MLKLLSKALADNQLELLLEAKEKLVRYLELMLEWNKVYNLTSITEPREMIYLHLIDSLMVQKFILGKHILDVGTGAGLPGIPLAIALPNTHWVLLDKAGKKTRFLTQAVAELGLKNVRIENNRCEDYHPSAMFDNILSRAFASLAIFAETTKHLLAQDGRLIAMKGKYPHDEIKNLPNDFIIVDDKRIEIKGIDVERHIIVLERNQRD